MAIGKTSKKSLESCMDVSELMKKLNKKPASQENEAKKEDETAGNLPPWTKAQQKGSRFLSVYMSLQHTKTKIIWQCVKSAKAGKFNCPDSKGIPEHIIEEAFLESYRQITSNDKDVMEEFLRRIEATLGDSTIREEYNKADKEARMLSGKRKKCWKNTWMVELIKRCTNPWMKNFSKS